jgi:uncharacterized membrane protein YraQ (UPF0718 family)/YHS domain-containing protein
VEKIIDPICGMSVDPASSLKLAAGGKEYFFCSTRCRDKFLRQEGPEDAATNLTQVKTPFFKNRLFLVSFMALTLVAFSYYLPLLEPFRKAFLMYLKTVWWAVLLGLFLGGAIDHYIPREYISKILARKTAGTIFNAVFLGFLMSACSHGILALSIQLHKKGASNPAVVSFLLASPWANLAITMMLLAFFGLKGLFIMLAAIIVAINTGLIFMFLEKRGLIEKNSNIVEVSKDFSIINDIRIRAKNYKPDAPTLKSDVKGVLSGTVALSDMVLWWIILGMLIASIAGSYIPTHFFHRFMGPTLLGLVITLGLATIIEVCSEGSSPLAFEIYRQTGALGNSFVFLMAGVATDYTEIGLLWTNVGRRVALWMPVVTVPQIVAIGFLANRIFR